MRLQSEGVDYQVGNTIVQVKHDPDSLRSIRSGLLQLAYLLAEKPSFVGYLLLVNSAVSLDRLEKEWARAKEVIQPEVFKRLYLGMGSEGRYDFISRAISTEAQSVLDDAVRSQQPHQASGLPRPDYYDVILKLLLYRFLTGRGPVGPGRLAEAAGCSYPTLNRAIHRLGSIVEQGPSGLSLKFFPREEFFQLVASSERMRATKRYVDTSGQTRSPAVHVQRLEKLNPPDVAIGGVLGAKYYFPDLDLVGTPRLDLSIPARNVKAVPNLVRKLDPALAEEPDRNRSAALAVHLIRHADLLFIERTNGLAWADPLECLLDLREARLEAQATQFLEALIAQQHRPNGF